MADYQLNLEGNLRKSISSLGISSAKTFLVSQVAYVCMHLPDQELSNPKPLLVTIVLRNIPISRAGKSLLRVLKDT